MKKFTVKAWSGSVDDRVSVKSFAKVYEADQYAAGLRASGRYKLISVVCESLGQVIGLYTFHQQGK